jgi:antitoxin Phd
VLGKLEIRHVSVAPSESCDRWSLQDAKDKLSAVVDAAAGGSPQIVTRRGVETAVIISYEEYQRITGADQGTPSLAQHLLEIPAAPEGELERIELSPRPASTE